MSVFTMFAHLLLERMTREPQPRVPETHAVMEVPEQVAAFTESGYDHGLLAYIYFFYTVLSLPLIRPGDLVLDLACGPANQLVQIAALHPDSQFIGVDASLSMLKCARHTVARQRLDNITLQHSDITCLNHLSSASIDAVLCTLSLHHLADTEMLERALVETRRVLKPGGGLFFADFGRLKRIATQRYFAYDRIEMQSESFTLDFLNSMRAAFSFEEMQHAIAHAALDARGYHTALAPFMMVFQSPARRDIDHALRERVQAAYRQLGQGARRDFGNLSRWFNLGGLPLPCPVR